ncbi:MAG: hypothetical protein GY769_10220 [bacterium]|nr:hypothetical protein [bacterium]
MPSADMPTAGGSLNTARVPFAEPVSESIAGKKELAEKLPRDLRKVERGVRDLAGTLLDAVRISPPALVSSVLGPPWTWIPPHEHYSEFKILDLWRLRRTIRFLVNTNVPSLPMTPPSFGPPLLDNLFWHPTVVLQRPDHNGSYTSFRDEHWFFINGIMTDDNVAQINAAYLAYLFHRPLTLIQNSTDAMLIDLLQCALGRSWHHPTEPLKVAFPAVYDALVDPHKRRVVVVCHSQGTIIMANVLRWLYRLADRYETRQRPRRAGAPSAAFAPPEPVFPDLSALDLDEFEPLDPADLAKLEVYAFATCAESMRFYRSARRGRRQSPWIEHYGNQNDIVARLGMLAPHPERRKISIDGPRFEHRGAWGHLLNAHYLSPIRSSQKRGRQRGGNDTPDPFVLVNRDDYPDAVPRLFDYINGGVPDS